jgi:hypothetical protein
LNLTDRITHQSEKAEFQAVNQHAAVPEALEQIGSARTGQIFISTPDRAESSGLNGLCGRQGSRRTMPERNIGRF